MTQSVTVLAVNIGEKQTLTYRGKSVDSGIVKVPQTHQVAVTAAGLAGDTIVHTQHHGGADQAVYSYAIEDYEWWMSLLGYELAPGAFGENLMLKGLPQQVRVGDRLQFDSVLLEATAPRIPCNILSTRMQDATFTKQFIQAERSGVYWRVINEGLLKAGDAAIYQAASTDFPTIQSLYRLMTGKSRPVDQIQAALKAPLAERVRQKFEKWLAQS